MKLGKYTQKLTINENIDSVCKFRTGCFIDKGIYPPYIASDKDEFDSSPNTFLVYVEENNEIISTVRLIKKEGSSRLPIEGYSFKSNGQFYNLKEMLERKLFDPILENVNSQLSRLAVAKKYQGLAFRRGLQICSDMFLNILKISFENDIRDFIICSSPCAKKIYEKFGAKSIYEGFFSFDNSLNMLHPFNLMYIARDDAASYFLKVRGDISL